MRWVFLTAVFFLLSGLSAWAQISESSKATGQVTGTVSDQHGEPLSRVRVQARMEETSMYTGGTETSDKGEFVIEGLEQGTYDIFGESDAGGYPNTALSFYGKEEPAKVFLTTGGTATVRLVLGPVAGIWSGILTDKSTGKPIVSPHAPHFIVRKIADPEDSIEFLGTAKFRWLIPPDVDVTLEIRAEGYEPWFGTMPLRFRSGENKQSKIELDAKGK
jgi:carboxypeptidase family protein